MIVKLKHFSETFGSNKGSHRSLNIYLNIWSFYYRQQKNICLFVDTIALMIYKFIISLSFTSVDLI